MAASAKLLPYIGREVHGLEQTIQMFESEITHMGAQVRGVNNPPAITQIGTKDLSCFAQSQAVSLRHVLDTPHVTDTIQKVRERELVDPAQRFQLALHPVVWSNWEREEMYILGRLMDVRGNDGEYCLEQEGRLLAKGLGISLASRRDPGDFSSVFNSDCLHLTNRSISKFGYVG